MQSFRRLFTFRLTGPTLSGLWYAYLWMMIGALILSLVLEFSSLDEQDLSKFTYLVHAAALFIGGWVSGRRTHRKGWIQGGTTGLLYGIVLWVISFLALNTAVTIKEIVLLLPAAIIGTIGSIIGKNLQSN